MWQASQPSGCQYVPASDPNHAIPVEGCGPGAVPPGLPVDASSDSYYLIHS